MDHPQFCLLFRYGSGVTASKSFSPPNARLGPDIIFHYQSLFCSVFHYQSLIQIMDSESDFFCLLIDKKKLQCGMHTNILQYTPNGYSGLLIISLPGTCFYILLAIICISGSNFNYCLLVDCFYCHWIYGNTLITSVCSTQPVSAQAQHHVICFDFSKNAM